jgi:glucose/arabinose dehydrogenase
VLPIGLGIFASPGAVASSLPAGFQETVAISGLTNPTAFRFAPDGRVFVAEKSGLVKEFNNVSSSSPTIVADLRTQVYNWWDRGLLGIALDPNFTTTRPYVYLLYTYDAPIGGTAPRWGSPGATSDGCPTPPGGTTDGCVASGRLSRIQVGPGNVMTGNELVLINDWCQQFPSHSIGTVAFGPDGALYAGAGEGANFYAVDYGQFGGSLSGTPTPRNPCGDPPGGVGGSMAPPTAEGGALRSQSVRTSRNPVSLDGSIIRVDADTGAARPDNPMAASADPNTRRIIAYGLRNPFRWTFRPGTNELWIGDVGASDWEEIDRIGNAAHATVANFGWPCYEGNGRMAAFESLNLNLCQNLYNQAGAVTPPYYTYAHSAKIVPGESCPTGSSSITGLAFYQGGPYPAAYAGALFFADYSRNCIWVMFPGSDGVPTPSNIQTFAAAASAPVDLQIGPGGDLFYADLGTNAPNTGAIRRISFGTPPPPSGKMIGLTTIGTSILGVTADAKWGNRYNLSEPGSFTQISAYVDGQGTGSGGQMTRALIYADSAGNPGALRATSATVTVPTGRGAAWVDFPISPPVSLPIGDYWLVLHGGPTGNAARRYGIAETAAERYNTDPFATGPADPFGPATTGHWRWSLFATYTPVVVSRPPTAAIRAPAASLTWKVNDVIAFEGSATDPQDGVLPDTALTWDIQIKHCDPANPASCHLHPLQTFVGVARGSFPAPEHAYPSSLLIRLTARNSGGATDTRTVELRPQTVALTLDSSPRGLSLLLNLETAPTPFTRTVIVGSGNTISGAETQTVGGLTYAFSSWSDGSGRTHMVTATASPTTYSAMYRDTSLPLLRYDMETFTVDGRMKDLSGNGHDGVLTGTTDVPGKVGRARHFGGTERITASAISLSGLDFTIAAWFNWTTNPSPYYSGIHGGGGSWELRVQNDGRFAIVFYQAIGPDLITAVASGRTYNDGTWHHAAGVLRSGQAELYVDGVLVARDTGSITSVRSSTQTVVGQVASDFIGDIDEVRVYSRALTASEIVSITAGSTQVALNPLNSPSDPISPIFSVPLLISIAPMTWSIGIFSITARQKP